MATYNAALAQILSAQSSDKGTQLDDMSFANSELLPVAQWTTCAICQRGCVLRCFVFNSMFRQDRAFVVAVHVGWFGARVLLHWFPGTQLTAVETERHDIFQAQLSSLPSMTCWMCLIFVLWEIHPSTPLLPLRSRLDASTLP